MLFCNILQHLGTCWLHLIFSLSHFYSKQEKNRSTRSFKMTFMNDLNPSKQSYHRRGTQLEKQWTRFQFYSFLPWVSACAQVLAAASQNK